MSRGILVTFEGPEGAGKSTQVKRLHSALHDRGIKVVSTFEPGGGSDLSKKIREILLSSDYEGLCDETELFLMLAARAEHVQKFIVPHLRDGFVVICDRFIDSTVAYQGYGRGLPIKTINIMNQFAISGRYPDLTVIFDVEPELGLKRAKSSSGLDRIESETLDFHRQVRDGFLAVGSENENMFMVNGADPIESIHQDILNRVLKLLPNEN